MSDRTGEPVAEPTPEQWLELNGKAPEPQTITVRFLAAMERRDLPAAKELIGDEFAMTFPGPAYYSELEQLTAGATRRYRSVAKRITGVDSCNSGDETVVWVRGTLYGENVHGVEFQGIRFTDRFSCKGGKLVTQDVWNDLAESGVLEKRPAR